MSIETAKQEFRNVKSLAIVGGAVSENLECLDFDKPDLFQPFLDTLEGISQELAASLDAMPKIKVGKYCRFVLDDVLEWLKSQEAD